MSPTDPRTLIAVRVVVTTTLLLAALIIQSTVEVVLPINYLYLVAGITYVMTLGYIGLARWLPNRQFNLAVQLGGDLVVETMLVYFTGGWDSPFSFLYLVTIITASMLLYRRGGLFAASGAAILFGGMVDLMYYGILRSPAPSFFSSGVPDPFGLYLTLGTNIAGFYATALLTSYISEKLRKTFEELDLNRQNLAELQALSRNVIESVPSGLMTITPYGTITFVNPAGSEILKLPQDSIVGEHLSDIGLFWKDEWDELRSSILTNRVIRGETTFVRGGEIRSVGYAMTPLNAIEGSSYGLTLIFQDLTEIKTLETQLRMKDRMAAVGELSAGIAHEIRNPLAAIAGSVQVLRNSKNLSDKEERLMSIILKESDRLNKSIADFLRFVKPQERHSAEFDIALSLSETLDLLSNSSELSEEHRIERAIEPPSFHIQGDADQIRQVFWNIAKNAIQAMSSGGTMNVSTDRENSFYRIHFTDNGRGMSNDDQRRIFQPFRTNFPTGTGLGMAISYRIIQEHGGSISVDSHEGRGTTITISLPA
ncbi:MAG TPA: ATP-binding protein [Thermoanaerobaculia bacterium]|nr:ATP-binding protein [Thermoanaerobaculia bacterium]